MVDKTEQCVNCERETADVSDDGQCLECEREALERRAEYVRDMAGDR